jgi:hypothetical protein
VSAVGPRSPELLVAVPEDDRTIGDAGEHPLFPFLRLRREAVDVRERRPVDVEDPVELCLDGQAVEPVDDVLGYVTRVDLELVGDLGAIERRLA